jgi:hypothetical protein
MLEHVAMFLGMLVAMLLRRDEYAGPHGRSLRVDPRSTRFFANKTAVRAGSSEEGAGAGMDSSRRLRRGSRGAS